MRTELWPPIGLIRSAFAPAGATRAADAAAPAGDAAHATGTAPAHDLLAPLTELARRREALAAHGFCARWAPGRLLGVRHEGRLLGVLLERHAGDGRWHGWMAAGECDWAGAFDVLLEPGDEPFEPLFGLIQAWNPVTLVQAPHLRAQVLGELSATRLAALRAVADEHAGQAGPAIAPQPGRIALRSVAGSFSVLCGTPLAPEADPRAEYQALYREAALQLAAAAGDARAAPVAQRARPAPSAQAATGWGARIGGWLRGDGLWRPALAVMALVVVVQNVGLLFPQAQDELRFRAPAAPPAAQAAPDLVVRWKSGTDMAAAGQLLRSAGATVVGGPDAAGAWPLRLVQPAEGRRVLQASPLVEALVAPQGP